MKHRGKKYKKSQSQLSKGAALSLQEGVAKVKELAFARFNESVDANVNLGIDPSKGDQVVRGSVVLPHGTGRTVKIAVFAKGDYADAALKAGADYVGFEDLVEKIEGGWVDFNYAIATPDLMGTVGKTAKVLGPRGLLPNRKNGTVTFDVAAVIQDLKKGRLFFKNDKNGLVHFSVGKTSFEAAQLHENLVAFIHALAASKPATSKGVFIKKITLSSTMGPGIQVSPHEAA